MSRCCIIMLGPRSAFLPRPLACAFRLTDGVFRAKGAGVFPDSCGFCDGSSLTHPDGLRDVRAGDPRFGAEKGTRLREKCLDCGPHGMSVLGGRSRFLPWQESFKANTAPVHWALTYCTAAL